MPQQAKTPIDETLARRVAGETMADLRTVRKALRGGPVRGRIGQSVRAKIAELSAPQPATGNDTSAPV